jgi:4-diphosphocytidyl-2C-methyl-D-erythritol kinase
MRLGNTFESVLGRNRGSFDALVAGLREGGARQVRLTGSGSAVFALLPDGVNGMDFVRRVHVSVPLFLVRSLGRGPVVSVQR